MKILFVDYHAGCIQTLTAALLKAGHQVDVVSYSRHNHILRPEIAACLKPSPFGSKTIDDFLYGTASGYEQAYDLAIGTFPPGIYGALIASGIAAHILIYVNHRMDLHVKPASRRIDFWKQVHRDALSGKVTFVAAHTYDAAYFEYYTHIPIRTVFPALVEDLPPFTGKGEVIIGPSHLEASSQPLRALNGIGGQIKTIRQHYPHYQLTDLANHRAAIVLPYSTYSQSVLELSDLGLPLLIPSDQWLLDNGGLNDVRLAPLYTSDEDGNEIEGSPNSALRQDRLKWIRYAHWNDLPNVYRWNDINELRALIKLETYPNYQAPDSAFFTKKRLDFEKFAALDFLRFT
jgi:hypothetical protein